MTQQESFKRRVRSRMEKTGEKYNAARRALVEQADGRRGRLWAAQPETSDEAVSVATGRSWDGWCDIIEAWPDHTDGHTAIAGYLQDAHGVDEWWAQSITVGYERISGTRLPHQMPDGTFTAGKTRTVTADVEILRKVLLDDTDRADLFPGWDTVLRSKKESKVIRIGIGSGVAQIALDPKPDGRLRIVVAHEKLPTIDDVEPWKSYWSDWLDAVDGD